MGTTTLAVLLGALYVLEQQKWRRALRDVESDMSESVGYDVDLESDLEDDVKLSLDSFQRLCSVLDEDLQDGEPAGELTSASCVYLTLRWLVGGDASSTGLMHDFGVSRETFYEIVWYTIEAIINSDDPHLHNTHFPTTAEELQEAAEGFRSVCRDGAITNCVSVIDGYLLEIENPSDEDYKASGGWLYSVLYRRYGFNIQAAVDSEYRFQFVAVAGAAAAKDSDAVQTCNLQDLIDDLPSPYAAVADAGYTATDALATLFTSHQAAQFPQRKIFNKYARPLLVYAETAFGLLVETYGVLQKPLDVELKKVWRLLVAVARLHNFRIDQGAAEFDDDELEVARRRFIPSQPQKKDGRPILEDHPFVFPRENGDSSRRSAMVEIVNLRSRKRPRGDARGSADSEA